MDDLEAPLLPLPVFAPDEAVCGNCKLWQAHSTDARGWVGPCRIQPSRGMFPPSAPICNAFVSRTAPSGTKAPEPKVSSRPLKNVGPVVHRRSAPDQPAIVSRLASPSSSIDLGDLDMTRDDLMSLLREAMGESSPPPLANKWEGGVMKLIPGRSEVQEKELPIDSLFHKVVMIRDRLRTLEQKINGHPKLTDGEKVEMQHYVTRVYGSLTSFNVLFRDKQDQFVGAKGDE